MTTPRFWALVLPQPNGCWEFQKSRHPQGYGRFYVGGPIKNQRMMRAHRFAYIDTHGPITSDQMVLHRCDNPPCCNPDHLYLGDHAQNNRDMMERGRANLLNAKKTHCPKGHPLEGDNLIRGKGCRGKPNRMCRICRNESSRKSHRKYRETHGYWQGEADKRRRPIGPHHKSKRQASIHESP